MPRVKITNLKPGPIVINSLKITISGKASVIRDASVSGDPDLSELEANGLIVVEELTDQNKPASTAKQQAVPPVQRPAAKPAVAKAGSKQGIAKQGPPPKQRPRPGTDFRAVDPEDRYVIVRRPDGTEELRPPDDPGEGKVVVVTETGPQVREVGPGINGRPGPKYAGDTVEEQDGQDDEEIPLSESDARKI